MSAVLAFLQRRKVTGCSKPTLRWYESYLTRFARFYPKVPVESLQLDKFLGNPDFSSEVRLGIRRTLMVFYHFLEEVNYIPRGLVEVPHVKKEKKVRRILTLEEIQSLWGHVNNFQEKCILQTLIDTKCRAGELVSLTRESIFPDHALVKGKVGERQVPLSQDTYEMLCQLRDNGHLFRVENRPMSARFVYTILHALMLRAGLTGVKLGPHIIRHTTATQHIMAGGDLQSLQQELGHTTPIMTAEYAHLSTDQLVVRHNQLDLLHQLMPQNKRPDSSEPVKHGGGGLGAEFNDSPAAEAVTTPPPPESTPPPEEKRLVFGIRTRKI